VIDVDGVGLAPGGRGSGLIGLGGVDLGTDRGCGIRASRFGGI
jgi:hypothetical protein